MKTVFKLCLIFVLGFSLTASAGYSDVSPDGQDMLSVMTSQASQSFDIVSVDFNAPVQAVSNFDLPSKSVDYKVSQVNYVMEEKYPTKLGTEYLITYIQNKAAPERPRDVTFYNNLEKPTIRYLTESANGIA